MAQPGQDQGVELTVRRSNADEDEVETLDPVQEAALYIQDAFSFSEHMLPLKGEKARRFHLVHLYAEPLIGWAVGLLVALSFFELPGWCAQQRECRESLRAGQLTGSFTSGYPFFGDNSSVNTPLSEGGELVYPVFGLPILPLWGSSLIEMLLLSFLGFELTCKFGALGVRRFLFKGPRSQPVFAALVVLITLDAMVRIFVPWPAGYVAPYLRIILLCNHSPSTRQELRLVGNTFKPLAGILIVLGSFLIFFSWVGILLFASHEENSQGRVYFTSIFETAYQLFILLTTANYPDVMMPAYSRSRFAFIFFGIFVTIGTFFLLNIVVAVVTSEYNLQMEKQLAEREWFRSEKLSMAFELLDMEKAGELTRTRMESVVKELNHYKKNIRFIDGDRFRIIFAALDTARTGKISRDEFGEVCELLSLRFKRIDSERSLLGRLFPSFFGSESIRQLGTIVRSRFFDYFIDFLLLCNAIFLIYDEFHILDGQLDSFDPHTESEWVEAAFTIVFSIEMTLKLMGMGIHEYKESLSNVFDGTVTSISIGIALWSAFDRAQVRRYVRYINAVRLGRLGRLLGSIPQIALVAATSLRMIPAAAKLLQVLFVAMFCFSTLGTQLFGGLINYGPQYPLLMNSLFGPANYFANNFNDLASGMVVCFELLVVNNWFVIASGFAAVANMPLVRIFFAAVYVFGVLVCLNIVVAFALDAFDNVKKSISGEADEDDEGEPEQNGRNRVMSRFHSESIAAAQEKYRPYVPSHVPSAGKVKKKLAHAAAGSPRNRPTRNREPTLLDRVSRISPSTDHI